MTRIFLDEDTGEECIIFLRRGKPFIFLRDPVTKRFIKKVNYVDVRVTITFEYKSKKHPLYIEAGGRTTITAGIFEGCKDKECLEAEMDTIWYELSDAIFDALEERFNPAIRSRAEIEGISFGTIKKSRMYPECVIRIMWSHDKIFFKEVEEVRTL